MQAAAVRTHGGQLTVQIQGSALADLVAGGLEDGVSHVIFVHHVMGDGHGISRLHGKARLFCAGIIDTLLHSFQCRVKHLFVGHIAHGLVIHLYLQGVGLADGSLEHRHHNSQRCHRQHIHGHAGHKTDVISNAMGKEVPTCAQRSAKAIFLAHPMCVAQQRPGAPQGKHYRAEQIPQQLRRPGKGHRCDIFQQFSDRLQQTLQAVLQAASCANNGILGRKAYGVQRLAHYGRYGVMQQLTPQRFPAVLALAPQPVPPQHTPALELRPQRAQLLAAGLPYRLRSGLLLLCFIFSQRDFLLPAPLQGIFSARNTAARWCTFPCSKGQQGLYTIRSLFIIHFARFETSAYIKFGYFFHAVFTKKALPYPAAAGFPP